MELKESKWCLQRSSNCSHLSCSHVQIKTALYHQPTCFTKSNPSLCRKACEVAPTKGLSNHLQTYISEIQKAAIASSPSSLHPQLWAELHTHIHTIITPTCKLTGTYIMTKKARKRYTPRAAFSFLKKKTALSGIPLRGLGKHSTCMRSTHKYKGTHGSCK